MPLDLLMLGLLLLFSLISFLYVAGLERLP